MAAALHPQGGPAARVPALPVDAHLQQARDGSDGPAGGGPLSGELRPHARHRASAAVASHVRDVQAVVHALEVRPGIDEDADTRLAA
jgi:hypothetical protein